MRGAVLAALLLLPGAAAALEVALVRPDGSQAVFGVVEVEAQVYPVDAPVARVEFFVDGHLAGVVERPPWRLAVDVGQDNVEHTFLAVAREPSGAAVESSVRTPRIATDDVLDVELQQLYVTVERGGDRIQGLQRDSFRIREDGVPQEIVTFARGDVPFTAVLLVDASKSMEGERLTIALAGAAAFAGGMRELDEAKLLLFSDRLLHETPFTSFPTVLAMGLDGVAARGGTAVNDHLQVAVQRLDPRQGRKVVVLLSDGMDIESVLRMDAVTAAVEESQAVLYWLRLREEASLSSSWRDVTAHQREEELLAAAVQASGGRIVDVERLGEVEAAFQAVLRELREHYVLGYYPSSGTRRGTYRVEVEVDVSGAQVRARGRRVARLR